MQPGALLDTSPLEPDEPRLDRRHRRIRRYVRRTHRRHRLRHHRTGATLHAADRVRHRRAHRRRTEVALRVFAVPVLALVPAALWTVAYPLNLVLVPALGVMGLVLALARLTD